MGHTMESGSGNCNYDLRRLCQHVEKHEWRKQLLLFWFYTSTLTHSVSKRIYMMTGHERRLMWLGIGEAAANLALSVTLVLAFRNVVAVAIGSLIPTLYFGWCKLWPWMARDIGRPPLTLLRETVLAPALCSLPAVLIFTTAPHVAAFEGRPWLQTLCAGSLAAFMTVFALWHAALTPEERQAIRGRFLKKATRPVLATA